MQKRCLLTTAMAVALMGRIGLATDDGENVEQPRSKNAATVPVKKVAPAVERATRDADIPQPAAQVNDQTTSPEEAAIRSTGESYAAAFSSQNAKAAVAHFTIDAEYVDSKGTVYRGQKAIEELLESYFAANPACKLELQIESVRFFTAGVAIEDGVTTIIRSEKAEPEFIPYTAVHVKQGDQWLTASVRDDAPVDQQDHRANSRTRLAVGRVGP